MTARALFNECAVLAGFLLSLAVAFRWQRRWAVTEIILMYAIGLLFELLTCFLWQYHDIAFVIPTPIDNDISALFPLGWAGWVILTTTLAEVLWRRWSIASWWARHLVLMALWLAVGDVAETFYYRRGMIEYLQTPHASLLYAWGQVPGLPPTLVLLGYAQLPPLVSQLFRRLEQALRQ